MLSIIEFLVNQTVSLIYGTLLFLIIKLFLPLRKQNLLLELLEIFSISYVSTIVIYPGETTGTLGSFLALIVVLLIFHKSSLFLTLSAAILIFPVMTAISYILQDTGSLIWLFVFDKNMSPAAETALHSFTMILRIPIWIVICHYVKLWIPHAVHDLTRRMWLLIDLVSLASFTGIITVIYKSTSSTSYIVYPACIASLITNLGCCYLCTYMAKTIRTEMQLETYQYQQAYYQELEKSHQAIRGLRHDMNNHLNIISTFLKNKEYGNASQYLNELNQEFVTAAKIYCPNSTVNAVLNAKEQTANSLTIHCNIEIDLQEVSRIDNIDLCSLLSNTLDNAIEACRKIPDESRRTLSLKARCKNGFFSYEIVNSKVNAITENSGHYQTDKEDSRLHGIGLDNVKRIVEKYGGEMKISYDDELFTVVILI